MVTTEQSIIGKGLYRVDQAARIIRVSLSGKDKLPPASTVYNWVRGRPSAYAGQRQRYAPIIQDDFPDDPHISFVNFVELWFIAFFRSEGVSAQVIRRAAEEAARLLGPHPFAVQRFSTDGQGIFADLRAREIRVPGVPKEDVMEQLEKGQIVMAHIVRPYLREISWGVDLAEAFWPCTPDVDIVMDPKRCFGQPIVGADTIPTRTLYRRFRAGDTIDQLAESYRTSLQAVQAAVDFERRLETA